MLVRLVCHLLEDAIRNISGPLGVRLRRIYYKTRCKNFGKNVSIDTGVTIQHPQYVSLYDNVWIDKNVTIIAGPYNPTQQVRLVGSQSVAVGEVIVGKNSHLGIGTVVQGHAGVSIGNCFTSSAFCCLYSLSNDPTECRSGTTGAAARYVAASIEIGNNVWLGLHTVVVGATIADDCFAKPFSLLRGNYEKGWIVEGTPAKPVRPRFPEAQS